MPCTFKKLYTSEIDPAYWNRKLSSSQDSSFFCQWEWMNLISRVFDYKAMARMYLFNDGTEVLLPLLGKISRTGLISLDSLPFGAYGGLISSHKLTLEKIQHIVNDMSNNWRLNYINININPLAQMNTHIPGMFTREGTIQVARKTALSRETGSSRGNRELPIAYKTRKQVNKAIRSGARCYISESIEEFLGFADIYYHNTRRWGGGIRGQKDTRARYRNLLGECFKLRGSGIRLWLVTFNGTLASGLLDMVYNDTAFAWLQASSPECRRFGVNDYIYVNAITQSFAQGIGSYNLGGSPNKGVKIFKQSLGAVEMHLSYYFMRGKLRQKMDSVIAHA